VNAFDDLDIDALRRRRGIKWTRYPADVLPAWVADMDFDVAEPISEALVQAIEIQDLGYDPARRHDELRGVFRDRVAERFGWELPLDRIALLTDVVQGLFLGVSTFSRPNARVVVQTPIYRPFKAAVTGTGRRIRFNPLAHDGARYAMDLDALTHDPQTEMLMLCNPHNPSGRCFERSELEALAETVVARDWMVLSDEIHADLVYDARPHIPFASLSPEVAERTITLMSASKAFNIAGLRCAFAIFGSDAQLAQFESIPAPSRGSVGSLAVTASLCALKYGTPWLRALLPYLQANRDWLAAALRARIPEIGFSPPEATYLAWLDCRALGLGVPPEQHFLERARVALSAGREFGHPSEASGSEHFVRLNFATSRQLLEQIVERMAKSL